METQIKFRQIVRDYFDGTLSAEKKAEFERLMSEDPAAQKEFAIMQLMVDGIRKHSFREKLNAFHRNNFPDDNPIAEEGEVSE